MDFVVNDASLHGQFSSSDAFVPSLRSVLTLRDRILRAQRVLKCHRRLHEAVVLPERSFREVLGKLPDRTLRGVVLSWLQKDGPFWSDEALHSPDEWFRVGEEIVTDTGLAEAAKAVSCGLPWAAVSFAPSNWTRRPLQVDHGEVARTAIEVDNHWTLATLEETLERARPPLSSWMDLVAWAAEHCQRLTLTSDVVRSLNGYPFVPGAAARFQELLRTLDTFKGSFDADGNRTSRGDDIYRDHFAKNKAWFTDSSDDEKRTFKDELTFPDPARPGSTLFCPMHGKVKIQQMRMHFTYPVRPDEPLYIVYIGPKLTKR